MAKKSQRRVLQHERSQTGCMSGLIGIFDFRPARSTRKLLSDKRHVAKHVAAGTAPGRGTLRLTDSSDKMQQEGGETESLKVRNNKTSVKKLIEEDMSSEQERTRPDPDCKGNVVKNHKETKKTSKVSRDIHVQESQPSSALVTQDYYQQNSSNRLPHLDIASLMEEFCDQIQHRQDLHVWRESGGDSCSIQECTGLVKPNDIDDMHMVQTHSVVQEKLTEAAEAFLNQKLIDARQRTDDGGVLQSNQFVDALDILHTNRELLLKLLQDSNSLLVKHIRDLQDAPSEEVEQDKLLEGAKFSEGVGNSRQREKPVCQKEVQKHHIHNFFWKKDKSRKQNPSKESDNPQVLNRIVVLKPNTLAISSPQSAYSSKNHGWSGKFNSQFSLSEIKKKLKNTMDGVPHKIPNMHTGKAGLKKFAGRELPSKSHVHIVRTAEPSSNGKREEWKEKPVSSSGAANSKSLTITTPEYSKPRVPNIYIEAKKHLEEILTGGDKDGSFSAPKSPKTLGRILSLPEYGWAPLCSPGRDGEHGFVTAQMRFSPNGSFRIVNENPWRIKPDNSTIRASPSRKNLEIQQDATNDDDLDTKLQELVSDPIPSDELPPGSESNESIGSPRQEQDSSPRGGMEIVEEIGVTLLEEDKLLDGVSTSDSTTEILKEDDSSECVRPDSLEDNQPSPSLCSHSSSDLIVEKVESPENISDTPERPSPVSVLEPFFDEMDSPTTSRTRAEKQIQQPHFDIEVDDCSTVVVDLNDHPRPSMEDNAPPFEYVRAVMRASNVNWEKLFGNYHSSEPLLTPSVFDEVELFPGHDSVDRVMLFDCINEVLEELYERYFGSSPWVAFISPDIRPAPMGETITNEVWEGVNWNLVPQAMPRTLDQIIGKDMEKTRTWMDIRSDAEVIGGDMADAVLEELLDDAVFDLCPRDVMEELLDDAVFDLCPQEASVI